MLELQRCGREHFRPEIQTLSLLSNGGQSPGGTAGKKRPSYDASLTILDIAVIFWNFCISCFMVMRKALSWDQMVLICSGLLLVKTKQCCAPFPQTAIKLEIIIIYSLVFQQCSDGSEATLSCALLTCTQGVLRFFIPRNPNLKWKLQMQSPLTSGCYQILPSTIAKPISQQYGFLFFPPQLEEIRSHITATADRTGWEDTLRRHHWSCCSSAAEFDGGGCFSFLHQNILCHVITQSRPPAPLWELFDL